MPPRARSPASKNLQSHYPAADTATFRDLLLFEERLKRNAGLLKRRKRRYQLYLTLLVSTVLVLLSDVLLETDLFILPLNTGLSYYYTYARPYLQGILPEQRNDAVDSGLQDPIYNVYPNNGDQKGRHYVDFNQQAHYNAYYPPPLESKPPQELFLHLPQYVKTAMLFILGMTLFLIFASGMYSEKVGYANKYVPHANKALRSFNMYLNVRTQPLPSRLSRLASKIGLSFLFPSPPQPPPTQPSSPVQRARTRSLSQPFSSRSSSPTGNPNSNWNDINPIIPQIPPSSNPRGELIFSSRVHGSFREAYERYRENYERKLQGGTIGQNDSKMAAKRGPKSFLDRLRNPFGRTPSDTPFAVGTPGVDTPTAAPDSPLSNQGTVRGRASTNTPSGSRRSSPAPGSLGKRGSKRSGRGRISRQGTPLLEIVEVLGGTPNAGSSGTGDALAAETGVPSGVGGDPTALVEVPSLGSGSESPPRRRPVRGRKGSSSLMEQSYT